MSKRDFIDIASLSVDEVEKLVARTNEFFEMRRARRPLPQFLAGKSVATLFLENSTRTRVSFELAAQSAGAALVSVASENSSLTKGETVLDTVRTLDAMRFDVFILRQSNNDAPYQLAPKINASLVNAGAGSAAHPSQALLDMAVLTRALGTLKGKAIAICGDILHSRVASSLLAILPKLGMKIKLIGPKNFIPDDAFLARLGLQAGVDFAVAHKMDGELDGMDALYCLRVQKERMAADEFTDAQEYFEHFGLTAERLKQASPKAVVLHPGPMNRGIEISSDVADGAQSRILEQVETGVSARLAILEFVTKGS